MASERAKKLRKEQNRRAYERKKQRNQGFEPTKEDYAERDRIQKEGKYEPLGTDGYLTIFRPNPLSSGYGENKNAGFLICPSCGQPLDKNGKCPIHGYG